MTKHANGDVTKEDVMSVLCQPMLDAIPQQVVQETRAEKLQKLEAALAQWRDAFEARFERRPTRDDMMRDVTARELFTAFAALRK